MGRGGLQKVRNDQVLLGVRAILDRKEERKAFSLGLPEHKRCAGKRGRSA